MNENQSYKHAFHKHASPESQKLFVCTSVHAARFSPAALHPLCMILNNDFDSRFGPQSLRQEYMDVCTICLNLLKLNIHSLQVFYVLSHTLNITLVLIQNYQ